MALVPFPVALGARCQRVTGSTVRSGTQFERFGNPDYVGFHLGQCFNNALRPELIGHKHTEYLSLIIAAKGGKWPREPIVNLSGGRGFGFGYYGRLHDRFVDEAGKLP